MDRLQQFPRDLGSERQPAPEAPPSRRDRDCPLPALRCTWSETLGFAFSLAAGATESDSGRVIAGPCRLRDLRLTSNAVTAEDLRLVIAFQDTDVPTTTLAEAFDNVVGDQLGDVAAGPKFIPAPVAGFSCHPLGVECRAQQSRLVITATNASAGTLSVNGTVIIDHLVEDAPAPYPD